MAVLKGLTPILHRICEHAAHGRHHVRHPQAQNQDSWRQYPLPIVIFSNIYNNHFHFTGGY